MTALDACYETKSVIVTLSPAAVPIDFAIAADGGGGRDWTA